MGSPDRNIVLGEDIDAHIHHHNHFVGIVVGLVGVNFSRGFYLRIRVCRLIVGLYLLGLMGILMGLMMCWSIVAVLDSPPHHYLHLYLSRNMSLMHRVFLLQWMVFGHSPRLGAWLHTWHRHLLETPVYSVGCMGYLDYASLLLLLSFLIEGYRLAVLHLEELQSDYLDLWLVP